MTEEKIKDIIRTLLEQRMMDYDMAMKDPEYLITCITRYIECANLARKSLNMPILV